MENVKPTIWNDPKMPRVPLPERHLGPFYCEEHPDRATTCTDARILKVIEPNGQVWDIYYTDDGFTIGDMKSLIALCPSCSASNYTIKVPES